MTNAPIRYVIEDVDRHGRVRVYFRREGQRKVRIRAAVGTPDFWTAYNEALNASRGGLLDKPNGDSAPRGTLTWIAQRWFASGDFKNNGSSTQRVKRRVVETMLDEPIKPGAEIRYGDVLGIELTPKGVAVLRDRKLGLPEAANARVKALRQMLAWAVLNEPEVISVNPAREVPFFKNTSDGWHSWTPEEVAQYEACHPIGSKARLALAILLLTGTRRSDAVRLGPQHARDGWLRFITQKTQTPVDIPILPTLQSIIDASPIGRRAYLVTGYNQPFSAAGFGNRFREWCNAAELPQCSAHGLRKAGATTAAENGATAHQLMAIFGWMTLTEAEHYTKAAQRRRMAGDGMQHMVRITNKETA